MSYPPLNPDILFSYSKDGARQAFCLFFPLLFPQILYLISSTNKLNLLYKMFNSSFPISVEMDLNKSGTVHPIKEEILLNF